MISAYATAIMVGYWTPQQPGLLAVALFTASTTYGALGLTVLGLLVFLRRTKDFSATRAWPAAAAA